MRLAYNTSDTAIKVISTLLPAEQARASIDSLRQSLQIQKISKVVLSTLYTASHNHTLDICRIVCTWSARSPDKCAKLLKAIKIQFLTLMRETQDSPLSYICYLRVKPNPTLIWKAKGYDAFYEEILIGLKQDRSELIQNTSMRTFCKIWYQGGHTCYNEACSLTSGKHREWLGMRKQMA